MVPSSLYIRVTLNLHIILLAKLHVGLVPDFVLCTWIGLIITHTI